MQSSLTDYLLKPLNRSVFFVVLVTVIAAELFIETASGSFRFSIGTVVFVYAVLSLNQLPVLLTALLVALSALPLSIALDNFVWLPREHFTLLLADHYSGGAGFLLLALLLILGGVRKGTRRFSARMLICLGLAVAVSNLVEALVRVPSLEMITAGSLMILLLMSAGQVFIIVGLIAISQFQKILVLDEQQRISDEKMLIVASDLYDDLFFMQKSMENIENIMAKSYNLHKKLKEMKLTDRSVECTALEVAEEVHEVKKDTVRILAGISEVIKIRQGKPVMNLSGVVDLVIRTNKSYAMSLHKKISFTVKIGEDLAVGQIYPLLAIMNNLVSNAVEAIDTEGDIRLKTRKRGSVLRITISDNGGPIRESNQPLIFETGFTTKFSADGVPSTGIGLAYVKGLVENFNGKVFFKARGPEKVFVILLPFSSVAGD